MILARLRIGQNCGAASWIETCKLALPPEGTCWSTIHSPHKAARMGWAQLGTAGNVNGVPIVGKVIGMNDHWHHLQRWFLGLHFGLLAYTYTHTHTCVCVCVCGGFLKSGYPQSSSHFRGIWCYFPYSKDPPCVGDRTFSSTMRSNASHCEPREVTRQGLVFFQRRWGKIQGIHGENPWNSRESVEKCHNLGLIPILVVGWATPSEKYESQLGWWATQYMGK